MPGGVSGSGSGSANLRGTQWGWTAESLNLGTPMVVCYDTSRGTSRRTANDADAHTTPGLRLLVDPCASALRPVRASPPAAYLRKGFIISGFYVQTYYFLSFFSRRQSKNRGS